MIVCVDIQAAIAQRAGVGRYTKSLVEHLAPLAGDDELHLFYFDFRRRGTPFPIGHARQRAVRWIPGRVVQKAWKTVGWPPFDWFAGRADLYHFPNFVRPPLTQGGSVVTVHDVSFLRYPEHAEQRNLRYLNAQIRLTVERADAVIADSAFSAAEIRELLNVPADRVFGVPLAAPFGMTRPSPEEIVAAQEHLGLGRPYLLMVGTLEPRKNIAFLVAVFEALTEFDGDLVLAGQRGWKYEHILERIRHSPRSKRIRHLDYVRDDLLPALYAGASAFVFPSVYEGFGLPPLEAMACGTPVVSSRGGSLPEILGDGAEYVEEFEVDAWAAVIRGLLRDGARRGALVARGTARARGFSWNETARRTWAIYRAVGRRK